MSSLSLLPDVFHPAEGRAIKPLSSFNTFPAKKKTLFSYIWLSAVTSYMCATSGPNIQRVYIDMSRNPLSALPTGAWQLIFSLLLRKLFGFDHFFLHLCDIIWWCVCFVCVDTYIICCRTWGCRLQGAHTHTHTNVQAVWTYLISQKSFGFKCCFSCHTKCILICLAFLARAQDTEQYRCT